MLTPSRPARRAAKFAFWLPLALVLLCAGCVSNSNRRPLSYRLHDGAGGRVVALHSVVVAPIDAELFELGIGGVSEKRDDWTTQATANLTAALAAQTGWKPSTDLTPEQRSALHDEVEDVQALLRAMTLNHLLNAGPGPVVSPFASAQAQLTYNTGPLKAHAAAVGCDGVLFVFVRDSYATAGRKSLMALSVLGAAFTGVVIVPTMGADLMSAALVEKDGTVLWFNVQLRGADPRTPDGARQVATRILDGLPYHSR